MLVQQYVEILRLCHYLSKILIIVDPERLTIIEVISILSEDLLSSKQWHHESYVQTMESAKI